MMELHFKPFADFIQHYTTESSRRRYADSTIEQIDVQKNYISAKVRGTRTYTVEIFYTQTKVSGAQCTCEYDFGGYCKHIIHTLVHVDNKLREQFAFSSSFQEEHIVSNEETPPNFVRKQGTTFILDQTSVLTLSKKKLDSISQKVTQRSNWGSPMDILEADFGINQLKGQVVKGGYHIQKIEIAQVKESLHLSCDCSNRDERLCVHLHFALTEIRRNGLLQLPFNSEERQKVLASRAAERGWTAIDDLDEFFNIKLLHGRIQVWPKIKLLSYTESDKAILQQHLLPKFRLPEDDRPDTKKIVLVETAAVGSGLTCFLMEAPLNKSDEIKQPIEEIDLHSRLRLAQNHEERLFYVALLANKNHKADIADYRDIVKNPLHLDYYLFVRGVPSDKITPKKILPIAVCALRPEVQIMVRESGDFYVLVCHIKVGSQQLPSKSIELHDGLFIAENTLYCLNNEAEIKVLKFFNQNEHRIYLQQEQFESFKEEFLDKLENAVTVLYSFITPAPKEVVRENSFDVVSQHYIYLSEMNDFVLITPALSYGDVEVPVLSRQTIYTSNTDGALYSIERNETLEQQFVRNVQAQHPSFDRLPQTEFYYLHKKHFLDDGWFIQAFEAWRAEGYTILGFNKLKRNRYNEYKIQVKTSVQSGIDWFDIHTEVSYGEQKVALKQLQKSIVNKVRFVELGDGTKGVLPQEWIDKFADYFRAGEIKDGAIRTHKSNFQLIDQLFENEVLSQEAQLELQKYKDKLANFHSISSVNVPKKLKAKLRDYQKEGLNWLNFLDEFGFGGCLADDMGLGKTVQVIAYFLAQHEKGNMQPNLVVLPTSLLFNWQRELDKFAPHLRYIASYGNKRNIEQVNLEDYHVVLTTYGTLLSDITFLKEQAFNIIVLDESQAIKNPDSKRYKAVRLLHARQRLVLTGTPVENTTFDLFAQLSFALPGLLGTAKRFADDYSTPIDKLKDDNRAKELQQKIHPFVLRRTKKQVAKELPEKTEMVIYCEMGPEQRRVYDAYKKEFQTFLAGIDEKELQGSSLHILQGLTKMRQLCNSPALLSDDAFYGNESAKLEELLKQVENLKDTHKILIFSQFVGMLELVKERLEQENINYAYLTGKTRNREEQVAIFQEDESVRVFLISLKAGGTGLNLTQAEYVFLIDPWWNPAVENQAIDRAYRIGQQNKVVAVRFITPDSIEEKIMDLQQRKRQLAEDLVHTDSNVFKQLKKDDLLRLL